MNCDLCDDQVACERLERSACLAETNPPSTPVYMKYIRHQHLGFILFEPGIGHAELADRLGSREQIVSGGFVFSPNAQLKCVGASTSLDVCVGPTDEHDLRVRLQL